MADEPLVLIDTCIWAPYFNRPSSREKHVVDGLLDDNRGAINGPILTEVLMGFRREQQASWVASELRGVHFLQPTWIEYRDAAKEGRRLKAAGYELPFPDVITAALALHRGLAVYSIDPHFDLFPDLMRFAPE